jgi:hypothetical protein
MIERLRIPLNDGEVDSVVVGVALDTFLAGAGAQTVGEMQAFVRRKARRNLGVTIQALESGFSAGEFVASRTVRGAVEIFVGPRQGARRNLGGRNRNE